MELFAKIKKKFINVGKNLNIVNKKYRKANIILILNTLKFIYWGRTGSNKQKLCKIDKHFAN